MNQDMIRRKPDNTKIQQNKNSNLSKFIIFIVIISHHVVQITFFPDYSSELEKKAMSKHTGDFSASFFHRAFQGGTHSVK